MFEISPGSPKVGLQLLGAVWFEELSSHPSGLSAAGPVSAEMWPGLPVMPECGPRRSPSLPQRCFGALLWVPGGAQHYWELSAQRAVCSELPREVCDPEKPIPQMWKHPESLNTSLNTVCEAVTVTAQLTRCSCMCPWMAAAPRHEQKAAWLTVSARSRYLLQKLGRKMRGGMVRKQLCCLPATDGRCGPWG